MEQNKNNFRELNAMKTLKLLSAVSVVALLGLGSAPMASANLESDVVKILQDKSKVSSLEGVLRYKPSLVKTIFNKAMDHVKKDPTAFRTVINEVLGKDIPTVVSTLETSGNEAKIVSVVKSELGSKNVNGNVITAAVQAVKNASRPKQLDVVMALLNDSSLKADAEKAVMGLLSGSNLNDTMNKLLTLCETNKVLRNDVAEKVASVAAKHGILKNVIIGMAG
ncbi:MAG: hypothetical protein HON43_02295 [Alphaproteobacteria bacterium]|jgi:hypothetical protein|nr:hypothetical protein [Alphaproteobacteria bacterium]